MWKFVANFSTWKKSIAMNSVVSNICLLCYQRAVFYRAFIDSWFCSVHGKYPLFMSQELLWSSVQMYCSNVELVSVMGGTFAKQKSEIEYYSKKLFPNEVIMLNSRDALISCGILFWLIASIGSSASWVIGHL